MSKPKMYRVNDVTSREGGYAGLRYGGRVGELKYADRTACEMRTGYPVCLVFPSGQSDGFYADEVTEVRA